MTTPNLKISAEFNERLNSLAPQDRIRAIVLLTESSSPSGRTRRLSRAERREKLKHRQSEMQRALPEIDAILEQFDGHRITTVPNLGSVTVETVPEGIRALANNPNVKAILEDQPITLSSEAPSW